MRKFLKVLVCSVLLVSLAVSLLVSCGNGGKQAKYDEAFALIESGNYEAAFDIFASLKGYKDSKKQLERFYLVASSISRDINGEVKGINVTFNEDNLPGVVEAYRADGTCCTYLYEFSEGAENKRVLKQNIRYYDGSEFAYEYLYDDEYNNIKTVCLPENEIFPVYEFFSEENYSKTSQTYPGGEQAHYELFYNDDGNIVTEIVSNKDGTQDRYENSYDENGTLIKTLCLDTDGEKGVIEYVYDENGFVIQEIYTETEGGKYVTDYTYNADGYWEKVVYIDNDGAKTVTEYTYDKYGNVVKEESTHDDGTHKITKSEYVWLYIPYDIIPATNKFILEATSVSWADD